MTNFLQLVDFACVSCHSLDSAIVFLFNNFIVAFFINQKKQAVSEDLVRLSFLSYGEIRNIDIPMLDPYRSDMQVYRHNRL